MKSIIIASTLAFSATGVLSYPVTAGVNCREGPGTGYSVKASYAEGDEVDIQCQTEGDDVEGNTIWDKTTDDCYVADYYIKTGVDDYVTDKCDDGGEDDGGDGDAGPITDDYPYSGSCGPAEEWNFYKCQCTSFVAWRINDRLGKSFTNQYKGAHWGNANLWDDAAKETGVTVDSNPEPGCIAQTNDGSYGHVAWVAEVNGDEVTVEEYNYETTEAYGKRTVSKGDFNYIHV